MTMHEKARIQAFKNVMERKKLTRSEIILLKVMKERSEIKIASERNKISE